MLNEVRYKTPTLYSYLRQCYLNPSILSFKDTIIECKVGAQQGDPTGPLIFSLAIHPIITKLKSELNLWFLDDGTIGDYPDIALSDIILFTKLAKEIGLEINLQ